MFIVCVLPNGLAASRVHLSSPLKYAWCSVLPLPTNSLSRELCFVLFSLLSRFHSQYLLFTCVFPGDLAFCLCVCLSACGSHGLYFLPLLTMILQCIFLYSFPWILGLILLCVTCLDTLLFAITIIQLLGICMGYVLFVARVYFTVLIYLPLRFFYFWVPITIHVYCVWAS